MKKFVYSVFYCTQNYQRNSNSKKIPTYRFKENLFHPSSKDFGTYY